MKLTKVSNFIRKREQERFDALTEQAAELDAKIEAIREHFDLDFEDIGDGIKKLVERAKEKGSAENPYTILAFPYLVAPGVHYEYKGVTYRYDGAKAQTVLRLTSDFVEVED